MLPNASSVYLTCMGPTSKWGPLREFIAWKLKHKLDGGIRTLPTVTEVLSPFGAAIRTETAVGSKTLTEWFTQRDGMIWGVGCLHQQDDTSFRPVIEAMLASWSWS
jgi:hypothetical protein